MSVATVVLCPPLPGMLSAHDATEVADLLIDRLAGVRVLSPYVEDAQPDDDARTVRAHWVAHLAIALGAASAQAPVLLVVDGAAGELAPALGFSQKAARRAVAGYVLVDAVVPPAESRGGDWPDAPVVYVASPAVDPLQANQARLRGWETIEVPDVSPESVASALVPLALR